MKRIVVIPAYNEATRIGTTINNVRAHVERVIVVDDGSTDRTADVAREAGAEVIRHRINRGQGAALKTGTVAALKAGADIVIHFDADGQHDSAALAGLVAPIHEGKADIVFGSRFMGISSTGMPVSRRIFLWCARQFSAFALGVPRRFTDPQSGLRAWRAEAAKALTFCQDRMAHCTEILQNVSRSNYRVVEVPVHVIYTPDTLAKGQKMTNALNIVWQLLLGTQQN